MSSKAFLNLLEDLAREQYEYKLSEHEKKYFSKAYNDLMSETWTEKAADAAYAATQYTGDTKMRYREGLAMTGRELTPRQLDLFIMTLEIVLSMHDEKEFHQ